MELNPHRKLPCHSDKLRTVIKLHCLAGKMMNVSVCDIQYHMESALLWYLIHTRGFYSRNLTLSFQPTARHRCRGGTFYQVIIVQIQVHNCEIRSRLPTQALLGELVFRPSYFRGEGRHTSSPKNACMEG